MRLSGVTYRAGSDVWLQDVNLTLEQGSMNVLLGATLAGKTTLLRVLAGLDRPCAGRVLCGHRDLTGIPVRERNVAMVYQQFINYPSLTVYENIASPLRIQRMKEKDIRDRVTVLADSLHLGAFLHRYPAELSGGQQQRTALARALAKQAELLLLDEPLVNLDYKLREELRAELRQLFANGSTTVVYATTEPQEALQLGGHTAVLHEGRVLQSGATLDVFRRPETLTAARAFSDPPLNVIAAALNRERMLAVLADGTSLPVAPRVMSHLPGTVRDVLLGLRPHELSLKPLPGAGSIDGRVELAEISGSHTYIHVVATGGPVLVAHVPGVHDVARGDACRLYVDPERLLAFAPQGDLLFAPEQ